MRILLLLAFMVLMLPACQQSSTSDDKTVAEQETVLIDSITNDVDQAIQELKDEAEAVAKEIDDLLEGI